MWLLEFPIERPLIGNTMKFKLAYHFVLDNTMYTPMEEKKVKRFYTSTVSGHLIWVRKIIVL